MLIEIDFRDKRPIYEQISDKMSELILRGIIEANEALPSVRSLAMDLSINPNTIQKAYDNLEQRGLCYSVAGRGRFASGISEVIPEMKCEFWKEFDELLQKALQLGITEKELMEHLKKEEEK